MKETPKVGLTHEIQYQVPEDRFPAKSPTLREAADV